MIIDKYTKRISLSFKKATHVHKHKRMICIEPDINHCLVITNHTVRQEAKLTFFDEETAGETVVLIPQIRRRGTALEV